MGLSQTRKIISVICAAAAALAAAALIISFSANYMLTSQSVLKRTMLTDSLVQECEKQLDAKYAVLSAESGIPERVFAQVKETYNTKSSLNQALKNVYSDENPGLYNSDLVEYFNKLCTEFLSGSNMPYDEKEVEATAQKAAKFYSDTVGFHNTDFSLKRINAFKSRCTMAELLSVMAIFLCALIIAVIYTKRKKGFLYLFAGISGGSLGASLCALLCIIFKVYNRLNLQPGVFNNAAGHAVKIALAVMLAAGIVLCAVSYLVFYSLYKNANKQDEDN